MQPSLAASGATGWAPADRGPQHRQDSAPAPGNRSLKGRSKHLLCCLLILVGLTGSATQNAFPLPQPSADSGNTPPESPAVAPEASSAPGADTPVEPPPSASAAGVPTEAPPPADNGADPVAGADLLTVTPVLDTTQRVPLGVRGPWHLVFDDDFDFLNTAVWTPYWFNDCNPKSVMNNVKTCSSNVEVANGEAVLQLTDAESGALLSTNPKDGVPGHTGFAFATGYAEARIYFPGTCSSGIPNWPAWWTVGQRFPHTGEIDIAEALAGDLWSVYHATEWMIKQKVSACWAGAYHTYGLHRKAGANDIYYDGRLVYSYASKDGNSPHYLLLNVGVSGGSRLFGERGSMRVDYVRVWQ